MEIRNPTPNLDGSINCEVLSTLGWLPFTARETDPNARGREIYELAKKTLEQSP